MVEEVRQAASFEDVWRAVKILSDVLGSGCWQDPQYSIRAAVT